jgi:hypothetical protein
VRLLLTLLLVLAPTPALAGVRLHGVEGTPLQAWADAALIPTPSIDVTVYPTDCGDGVHLACASRAGIWIAWANPNLPARRTLLHEIGHHVDYGMHWYYRDLFQRMTGTISRPWRSAPNSPHEQFAETYAVCALNARRAAYAALVGRKRSMYRRSLCALLGAAALSQTASP